MRISAWALWMAFLFVAGLLQAAPPPAFSSAPVTVPQILLWAERESPDLRAAADREKQAESAVGILQSFYYPTLDAQALDSWGFPASNGGLGIQGLMASPFRSGAAGGVVSKLTLVDFTRGYSVQAAREELQAAREESQVVRFRLDQAALQIFLEAARFRGQQQAAHEVGEAVGAVEREVDHFVRTGQRSVVERLLVQDQTQDAAMNEAAFKARYDTALQRLALTTGAPLETLACPSADSLSENDLALMVRAGDQSPLLSRAAAEALAAKSEISAAQAENWPRVTAMASAGEMSRSRVVSKENWAGGFGVDLPIFEGYRTQDRVKRAQALAAERDHGLLALRLQISDLNAHYDEIINSSRVKLQYLDKELEVAQRAFRLARDRYTGYQGTLVDLREAIRNLARVRSEIIDVKTDLLAALGSKALLNGAHVS